MKIIIRFATYEVGAELYDTPTGRAIYRMLPIQQNVNTWGEEIYFPISVNPPLEADASKKVTVGDLAYWPRLPAFCIFFGPTPASTDETPVAASAVNIFGRLTTIEPEKLKKIPIGENVKVLKADRQ
jgi:hypothetical protein